MSSPRWIVPLVLFAVVVAFQNCAETLPENSQQTAGPSVSPAPAPAPTPLPQPAPGPVPGPVITSASISLSSASAGPAAVLPGGAIQFLARVTSNQALSGLTVRFTARNSSQTSVWQGSLTNQSLAAATAKDFVQVFNTAENLPAGNYSLGAEILKGNEVLWSQNNMTMFEVRPAIRVAVGRTTPYTDSQGRVWSADFGFTGLSVPWTEPLPSAAGTNDPELYTSFRFGWDSINFTSQTMTFTTPVPSAGRYKVTLKWIEHYVFGPNLRIFNVSINGTTVLANFDLFTAAGGAYIVHDRSFTVSTAQASPQIIVTFSPGPIENPKINAIEILGAP